MWIVVVQTLNCACFFKTTHLKKNLRPAIYRFAFFQFSIIFILVCYSAISVMWRVIPYFVCPKYRLKMYIMKNYIHSSIGNKVATSLFAICHLKNSQVNVQLFFSKQYVFIRGFIVLIFEIISSLTYIYLITYKWCTLYI